jgi:hypothetical protein
MKLIHGCRCSASVNNLSIAGFNYSSVSFNPTNLNRLTSQSITTPFPNDPADNLTLIPYIRTLSLQAPNSTLYFNITQLAPPLPASNTGVLSLFANYSYVVEACVSVVVVKQSKINAMLLMAYERGVAMRLRSTGGGFGIGMVAGNNFGISSVYGPILEGKCMVGLQSLHLRGNKRDSLSFDLSTSPPTSSSGEFYSS